MKRESQCQMGSWRACGARAQRGTCAHACAHAWVEGAIDQARLPLLARRPRACLTKSPPPARCARSADISVCFGGRKSVEDVYAACEQLGGQWGIDTIALMSK